MARLTLLAVVVGATLCSCGVIVWSAESPRPDWRPMTRVAAEARAHPFRSRAAPSPQRRPAGGDRWTPVHSATGPRFRVESNFSNQAMVLAALDAAEAAWPEVQSVVGSVLPEPERPLEVRLLRTRSDYEEIDELRNGGKLKDYAGFADCGAGTAFVAPDEADPDDDVLTPLGMGSRVTTTVAHEAAHLAAGGAVPHWGPCPWFDEGLAEVVEERVLLAGDPAASAGAQPALCAAMRACTTLRRAGALPAPREILAARPERLATFEEYAVAWAFFRLLNEPSQRDRTARLLVRARGLPPGRDFPAALEGIAKSVWGEEGLAELADEWPKYVDAFAPQWTSVGGRFCVRGGRWAHVAARGESVSASRTRVGGAKEFVVSGAFTILRRGSCEVAVLLGETPDGGGAGVRLSSTRGVCAYDWPGAARDARMIAEDGSARPRVGERTRFEIRVSGDKVAVSLDGRVVVRGALAGRDMTGSWGVAAFEGSAVVWENVELK